MPTNSEVIFYFQKIQMLLKSTKGEIDVFLCPDPHDYSPAKSNVSSRSDEEIADSVLDVSDKSTCKNTLSKPLITYFYFIGFKFSIV